MPRITRTDWAAPHWEAVALEQLMIDPTLKARKSDRTVRILRAPHGGRDRLRDPETGGGLLTDGDVAAFGPFCVLRMRFKGEWHLVPSHAEAMRWTLDGMADTPDGRTVEPDDRDSWLSLCGLV